LLGAVALPVVFGGTVVEVVKVIEFVKVVAFVVPPVDGRLVVAFC
jgi:hypothetical protein